MLQGQPSREINLRQACHEIAEKSSEIVPSGAPLSFGPILDFQVLQSAKRAIVGYQNGFGS